MVVGARLSCLDLIAGRYRKPSQLICLDPLAHEPHEHTEHLLLAALLLVLGVSVVEMVVMVLVLLLCEDD